MSAKLIKGTEIREQILEEITTEVAEIKEKHGDEIGAAEIYHEFGIIARAQRDYQTAEKWYQKSLEIKERHGDEIGAALTYHELGIIAQKQRDYQTAEKLLQKSLEISERHGNQHMVAITCGQLGVFFGLKEEYKLSGKWLIRSIRGFENVGDNSSAQLSVFNFVKIYKAAPAAMHDKLKTIWNQAGFGDFESLINNIENSDPES